VVDEIKSSVSLKKLWIKALILDCPFGESLPSCPMNCYRTLDISKRMYAAETMSEKDMDDYIKHHKECSERRSKQIKKSKI